MKNDACGRLAAFGSILERLGNVLWPFWDRLGASWAAQKASGAGSGRSWVVSWAS